jgi:hypothetical protein
MTGQVLLNTTTFHPAPYNPPYTLLPHVWNDSSSTPSLSLSSSGQPATSSYISTVMPPYCGSQNNSCNTDGYGKLPHNGTANGTHPLRNNTTTVPPPSRPSSALLSQLSSSGSYAEQPTSSDVYYALRASTGLARPGSYVPENRSVPAELRQNPRRTSNSRFSRGCPPALPRQDERKEEFVEKLVGKTHYTRGLPLP